MRLALTAWLKTQVRKLGDIRLSKHENAIDEHALLYQATIAPAYMPTANWLNTKS